MKTLNIRYKDGFKIEEDTRLYPINSNINDKVGVLVEHRRLNGSNRYLRYGIQKLSGKYYFFDVRNSVISKTKESAYNTFICPYCGERMFIVSAFERQGTMVPVHLKHYQKTNKECIFRSDSKSMKLREDYYKSEEFIHREIQDYVCKTAKEGFKLSIPNSYKLYKNLKTNTIRADIQKERVNIVNARPIYNTSQKNNKKYTPDIILYTDNNREIYCEISVYKSVNTADYFEEWKALGKTVIEIRKTEIMDMHLDGYRLSRDLIISYLYDPILDKARKQKINESQKLIDNLNSINSITLKSNNLNKEKYAKVNNNKDGLINSKGYKEFTDKVDYEIKKHREYLFEQNLLRAEYRYIKTKTKKNKGKKSKDKENNKERQIVFVDVKSNRQARFINAEIKQYNKVVSRRILAITGNHLRNKGYKVSVVSEKRK